ncbi:hypothetical protein [Pendulispora albinea]|uniref:Uncharacterized protein n=1 Tax=Pendulispora albinea TaxID=2741071 RepID=A0ABZ2M5K9_9BACT
MIRWPSEDHLSDGARHALARFRETAAAQDLAESEHVWKLEATSWSDELPAQLVWHDERQQVFRFYLEDPRTWWVDHGKVAM